MKHGNWVPIDKRAIKFIPDDRPFSELEALFSLQVAYDCKQDTSVLRFANLWKWSRNKVRRFMKSLGLSVEYTGNKHRPKSGQLRYNSGTTKGQLKFLVNNVKKRAKDNSGTPEGQLADTGSNPNPNPNPKDIKKPIKTNYPEWLPQDLFCSFLKMRKDIKSPLKTEHGIKLAIAKLERLKEQGNDPTLVIEQTIFHSWKGFFPLKEENKQVDIEERSKIQNLEDAYYARKNAQKPATN